MNIAEAITKFSIEVLQMEETKNSPEMVRAITELLNIGRVSNIKVSTFMSEDSDGPCVEGPEKISNDTDSVGW